MRRVRRTFLFPRGSTWVGGRRGCGGARGWEERGGIGPGKIVILCLLDFNHQVCICLFDSLHNSLIIQKPALLIWFNMSMLSESRNLLWHWALGGGSGWTVAALHWRLAWRMSRLSDGRTDKQMKVISPSEWDMGGKLVAWTIYRSYCDGLWLALTRCDQLLCDMYC